MEDVRWKVLRPVFSTACWACRPLLLALAGLGQKSLHQRLAQDEDGGLLDESIGHFAATIRQRPLSAVQIALVLSDYFGQPIRAEQFIGFWYDVPPAQQTILGSPTAVLGASAMAGVRVWQRDLRLRLVVGPLDRAGFDAFLPGGQAARALKSMLGLFTGLAFEYEVELVVLAAAVNSTTLDTDPTARLGWDTYLVTAPQEQDRHDVCYEL